MFLDVWDVRLEISVVSTHVNLNGLSVHVKNRKMENLSVHWFQLTHLNKSTGEIVRKKYSKTQTDDEILPLSINTQFF